MATKAILPVYPAYEFNAHVPTVRYYEGIGQSFKQGQAVKLSGPGLMMHGTAGAKILGFAADDATQTISSEIGVWVAMPGVIFEGNIHHTATSAAGKIMHSDIGTLCALTNLSGITVVDKRVSGATSTTVVIVGFKDNVGDQFGRVYFTVKHGYSQFDNP